MFITLNIQVFYEVILGGFFLGNALPEIETFLNATGAAASVFEIIDRVSEVVLQ